MGPFHHFPSVSNNGPKKVLQNFAQAVVNSVTPNLRASRRPTHLFRE
jgi:hypothetical protein